jgi:hypothetical protein
MEEVGAIDKFLKWNQLIVPSKLADCLENLNGHNCFPTMIRRCHLRQVMHAKYMHELCSLLMHIPTNYNVISCYNHVLMFYVDFPSIPLILVITLQSGL